MIHVGWGVGPGGGVRGGGHVLVLCWRGGGGWPAFESSVWGGQGLRFCGGVEPPSKPQVHRSPSHAPMRVWGVAVHLWLGRRPEVVVL